MTSEATTSSIDSSITTEDVVVIETLTNRQPIEVEVDEDYIPTTAVEFSSTTLEEFKNFGNHQQLSDCSPNVVAFLNSIYQTFGVDLTTEDITVINTKLNTPVESWKFFKLLIIHQIQMVVMGYRKSTTETMANKKGGPTGSVLPNFMGNVRPGSNRSAQQSSVTDLYPSLQAINTLMSVIGQQVPIDAKGTVGTYNNGTTLNSTDYSRVNQYLSEGTDYKSDTSPEGLKIKQILECIHVEMNKFLTNRSPRIFNQATVSFSLTTGNSEWLSNEHRAQNNTGSYYLITSNSSTTTGLSTSTTLENRKQLRGLSAGNNNALVLTAESHIFKDFWKTTEGDTTTTTEGDTTTTTTTTSVKPEELFEKGFDSVFNRSLTLPSGGYLLGYNGTTPVVNQNMIDLLSINLKDSKESNVIDGITIDGNILFGALTLELMRLGGYPVLEFVKESFLANVVKEYKLDTIISPFASLSESDGTLPKTIITDSSQVERSQIPLRAAWLINLIIAVVGSSTQGAALAITRANQSTQEALENVDISATFEAPQPINVEASERPSGVSS